MVNNMMKIFKSKKNRLLNIKKILVLLLISFLISFFISKIPIFKNNKVINILKKTSLNEIPNVSFGIDAKYLLNIGFNTFDDIKFSKEVFKQTKKDIKTNNIIYVYNTHQTEEYKTIENYNLTPTVLTASLILKDMLKDYGVEVIVEERDLLTDLKNMNLTYNKAYYVSEKWLNDLNNKDLKLYIDLHRDSVEYKYSNVSIDGKDYAKILFVIGTKGEYQGNMSVAESIDNEIKKINPSISRGIFTRYSTFNQDFSPNNIIIEVGGVDSSYESVSNSLSVLALAIKNYLGD